MAKQATGNKTGSSNLLGSILIYFLILAVAVFFGVFQPLQKKTELSMEVKKVQAEIQRQEKLFPVYADIERQLSEQLIRSLPLPGKRQLSEDQIEEAKQQLREVAEAQGLHVLEIHHDPHSLEQQGGQVLINCKISGDFMLFRDYLVMLGATDFVKHIEQVEMQESNEGVIVNLKLRLSVATQG